MPDAKPAEAPKTDTILADTPPMTPTQALRQLGWIQPVDFVIMAVIVVVWITLLYWNVFSEPSPMQMLSCCLTAFALTQLWAIILIYRCAHFVLMLSAYVNNMPDAAARMVIGYYSGRPPAPPPRK
jgi:hypothetical protein